MAAQYRPTNHSHISSRHSYPSFISFQDSLKLQLKWVWRGLYDAFRWNVVVSTVAGDAEIRANVFKSLLLNSLSLISIYTFDLLLLPLVQDQQRWFHRNIGWFYQVLWLLPVVGISFYLNSSWCSIIAKRTYTLQYGTRAAAQQKAATYTGMLTAIATSAYRVVMVFNSVVVSFALHNIPYVGWAAGFVFLCWVDAFVWMARGLSLSRRIRHLEERWAYYFAFGLPSAALCTCGTGLANAAIFALVFPAVSLVSFIRTTVFTFLRSTLSWQWWLVPSLPTLIIRFRLQHSPDEAELIRHPSPFVPIRLPIFALVMWLNDTIVRVLSVGPRKRPAHGRTLSDTTDSVEEGENMELKEAPRPTIRPARGRINIGRRKAD
ncbi:etoposide-induced protein 2.4-domain-containing protein [Lyophyllum atratum]|nr:etoposide-induced protein 2.4-domain-containing protein [Lyophyllum atratum]